VRASEGFEHPHDQRRLPHALQVPEAGAVRRLLGERRSILRGFRGLTGGPVTRRHLDGAAAIDRRQAAAGGATVRVISVILQTFFIHMAGDGNLYFTLPKFHACAPWALF